jgi:hypothetical protein
VLAVLATVGLVAAPGCSSSDDDSSALSRDEYVEQVGTICTKVTEQIVATVGELFAGEPTPQARQEALDSIVSASQQARSEIAALTPPDAMRDDVDELLTAYATANDDAAAQGPAFFDSEDDPWKKPSDMAVAMGIKACAAD